MESKSNINIVHHSTPSNDAVDAVVKIIESLGRDWFSDGVSGETRRDLSLQHLLTAEEGGKIVSFLTFTSVEGDIRIGMIATQNDLRNRGYGKSLIKKLKELAISMGYNRITCLTVPENSNPNYASTLTFYERCGFKVTKRLTEIWQSGALELSCDLIVP